MSRTSYPHVYRAIARITADFAMAGIPKLHTNLEDQYQYRSIDDVTFRLAPLLARHQLCVLPCVLSRESEPWTGVGGEPLVSVRLLVRYDLVSSRDGSRHSVQAWGEALDHCDKGTAKAMSSAFKSAMLQAFCVPVSNDDADAASKRLDRRPVHAEPPQGWSAWSEDMTSLIGSCVSLEALARLRSNHSAELSALKRERVDLYTGLGQVFAAHAAGIAGATAAALSTSPSLEASDA